MVHAGWFVGVSILAFLVPLLFSSILDLHHDLYLLIYFGLVLTALVGYLAASDVPATSFLRERWQLSLALGVLAGAFVVWSVLGRIDSTPHPEGAYFAFEIAWRGLIYGLVDALLLSAFPGLVALNLLNGHIAGISRRIEYGLLSLLLVMTITAAYHAGYEDLQNREGILNPEIGNTIISLPVIASANPVGSLVAHSSMHLAAVTHAYESKDRLPPQTFVDEVD